MHGFFFFNVEKYFTNIIVCIIIIRKNTILIPTFLCQIWFVHFSSNQFGSRYFQLAVNLIITINSLTENVHEANGLDSWQSWC